MSSQFYSDMSKVEKKLWGISRRQVKAYFLLVLVAALLIVEVIFLPDSAYLIVTLLTAGVLAPYPVYLLTNKWREKKRQIALRFIDEDRVYQTGQIRRYEKHEFIQRKEVKETDRI